jgi:hypothetical protein
MYMQSSSSIQLQAKPTILTYQAYQAKPTAPKTSTSQAHGHGWLGWLVAISAGGGGNRVFLEAEYFPVNALMIA